MLIKVSVRRILEAPLLPRNIKTNNPVIASSWMIDTTMVAFIFHTELTLRIVTRLDQLSCRNLFWILFRLREIDGNLQFTVVRWYTISNILCDSLQFDVVILLTEFVEIRNCLFWSLCIGIPKITINLTWTRRYQVHEVSTENLTRSLTIFNCFQANGFLDKLIF